MNPRYPVRRGLSLPSLLSLEYWIVRPSAQLRTRRTMTTKYGFAFSQRIAPEVCMNLSPPRKRRVQGMPGARCTRGLVCNVCIEMRTRAYRYSRNTPIPCAMALRLMPRSPGDRARLAVDARKPHLCEVHPSGCRAVRLIPAAGLCANRHHHTRDRKLFDHRTRRLAGLRP